MKVKLPSIEAAKWHKELTHAILSVAAEFDIEADEPGMIVHIPQMDGANRGILTVSWHIDKQPWGIKIVWSPGRKPSIIWMCEQVRAHLEVYRYRRLEGAGVETVWQHEVRCDILDITMELKVRASRYGPMVEFRSTEEGLGRLTVVWYDEMLRYDFKIEWPTAMRPTAEYMRVLARLKIEQVLARIASEEC